jgi:hypothetical protein
MEVMDNLSSKIVNVYDYFANYFLLFVLVTIIVYSGYLYLGGSDEDKPYSSDDGSNTMSNFGLVHIIISFIITIITLWVFIHILNHIFDINIIRTIKSVFSNQTINNTIDSIDEKIKYAENKIIGLFKDVRHEVHENSHSAKHKMDELRQNADKLKNQVKDKVAPVIKEEVFNISNNKYTYNDAKSICSAYNSRLATYKEVEDSYNAGGEWCNYGWSENQLALFPTQGASYEKLQKIKGHEHDCGRPGVNGGYIENSEIKFGINCYGVKPKPSKKDEDLMKVQQKYPKSPNDIELEKKVEYWKQNIDKVTLSAFNHDKWSRV